LTEAICETLNSEKHVATLTNSRKLNGKHKNRLSTLKLNTERIVKKIQREEAERQRLASLRTDADARKIRMDHLGPPPVKMAHPHHKPKHRL
jgi:hypothetical protein